MAFVALNESDPNALLWDVGVPNPESASLPARYRELPVCAVLAYVPQLAVRYPDAA